MREVASRLTSERMRTYHHRIAVIAAAIWVIALPFAWARYRSWAIACPYADILPLYWPELSIGAVAAVLLPGAWMRKPWATVGLIAAALFLVVLKVTSGAFTPGAWLISILLLLVVAWGAHFAIERPHTDWKRAAMRMLLTPIFGLAAIGTPSAYLFLAGGIFAGLEGIAGGKYFFGALLCGLSLLASWALWKLWSSGALLWRHGAYTNVARDQRVNDGLGLLGACIALAGFIAMSEALYRTSEVIMFSVLLAPAVLLVATALLWGAVQGGRDDSRGSSDLADPAELRYGMKLKLADLLGVACGAAIGLAGVFYVVPRPISGWGPCDWTAFYPLYGPLWPQERPIVFDACSDDALTLTFISIVLSIVCLIAGAFAAAIGPGGSPRRGAWAAAIAIALVLAKLTIQVSLTPSGPYIAWVSTLAIGASVVLGAAWLGHLGGRRGARWRNDRAGRARLSERSLQESPSS